MRTGLERLVSSLDRPDLLALYKSVESTVHQRKGLRPDIDFPTAITYHLLGFDAEMFTTLFAASRVSGWTAHIMEQQREDVLITPLANYRGRAYREIPW